MKNAQVGEDGRGTVINRENLEIQVTEKAMELLFVRIS